MESILCSFFLFGFLGKVDHFKSLGLMAEISSLDSANFTNSLMSLGSANMSELKAK